MAKHKLITNPDPLRLDMFTTILKIHFPLNKVWIVGANVGGDNPHFSNYCQCSCTIFVPPGATNGVTRTFGPNGAFSAFTNHTDQNIDIFIDDFNLQVQRALVYISSDGINWTLVDIPNAGWGIDQIFGFNGELVITAAPGGSIPNLCTKNCADPNGHVVGSPCEIVSGIVPATGASAAYSLNQGKTWQSISSDLDYQGATVTDQGPAGGASDGEKIRIQFGHADFSVTNFNIVTPWPTATRPDLQTNEPVGDNTLVRRGNNNGSTATIETSTDGGNTYNTTLTITSSPAGYLQIPTLGFMGATLP